MDLHEELQARNSEVLGLSPVQVSGNVRFESGLFFLDYQMTYDITLASSRSLQPVVLHEAHKVNELFVANEAVLKEQDLIDEDSANADVMELCMLIDVDFEDIEPIYYESGGFNV